MSEAARKQLEDMLRVRTPEELAMLEPLSQEDIAAALEEGRKMRDACERAMPSMTFPNLYFR